MMKTIRIADLIPISERLQRLICESVDIIVHEAEIEPVIRVSGQEEVLINPNKQYILGYGKREILTSYAIGINVSA